MTPSVYTSTASPELHVGTLRGILHAIEHSKHGTAEIREGTPSPARRQHVGCVVAGIGVFEHTGTGVQNAVKKRCKHAWSVPIDKRLIQVSQTLTRGGVAIRSGPQDRLGDRHEQRRGNAFAADVAHHEGKMLRVEQEEIEQVAAHFPGGDHGGVKIEIGAAGEGRKGAGQHGALDHRGVLHLARPQTLGLLHLGQARIFDSHGRHTGHHGEQAQILAVELLDFGQGIEVEQADDTVPGLQRHGHQTPDLGLEDAGVNG